MICAFSPSSVSGCDSLAIKHAVSGLCCVWVFRSSGLPWPLLRGSGIWWAGPVQGSGRLPGPHQPLASAEKAPGPPRSARVALAAMPGLPPRPAATPQLHHCSLEPQPTVGTVTLTQLHRGTGTRNRKIRPFPPSCPTEVKHQHRAAE